MRKERLVSRLYVFCLLLHFQFYNQLLNPVARIKNANYIQAFLLLKRLLGRYVTPLQTTSLKQHLQIKCYVKYTLQKIVSCKAWSCRKMKSVFSSEPLCGLAAAWARERKDGNEQEARGGKAGE